MTVFKRLLPCFAFAGLMFFMAGCNDKWDQHIGITDPDVSETLGTRLSQLTEVSDFKDLLIKSGLDKTLSASNAYTIFAPDNAAIQAIGPAILSDSTKLSTFVKNHIATAVFRTDMAKSSPLMVKMLSGKTLLFSNERIENVSISGADNYASNGIIHIIRGSLDVKKNIWEYLEEQAPLYHQAELILALDAIHIYPDNLQDSGDVNIDNEFIKETYNIKNEENRFTLLLVDNESFDAHVDSLKPYVMRSSLDTTAYLAKHFTARDLVFEGEYQLDQLPDTLISKFGVKIPVDKSKLVRESLSNGVVYKLTGLKINTAHRLLPVKVEGEKPFRFSADRRSNTYYREKKDPNGTSFKDIMVQNHKVALFQIDYTVPMLYSTKYKVYWRAINDIQANVFQQRLQVGGLKNVPGYSGSTITTFPYTNVSPSDYSEVYLGEFTMPSFSTMAFGLIGANSASDGTNTVTLDYIKLVPVIK